MNYLIFGLVTVRAVIWVSGACVAAYTAGGIVVELILRRYDA